MSYRQRRRRRRRRHRRRRLERTWWRDVQYELKREQQEGLLRTFEVQLTSTAYGRPTWGEVVPQWSRSEDKPLKIRRPAWHVVLKKSQTLFFFFGDIVRGVTSLFTQGDLHWGAAPI